MREKDSKRERGRFTPHIHTPTVLPEEEQLSPSNHTLNLLAVVKGYGQNQAQHMVFEGRKEERQREAARGSERQREAPPGAVRVELTCS